MGVKQIERLVITPHPTGNVLYKNVNKPFFTSKENQIAYSADKSNEGSRMPQRQQIYFGNYKNLFNKLIQQNSKFFTNEYGKSELEFQNYLQNKTDLYDNEQNFLSELEPKFDLKAETKLYHKCKKLSLKSYKKKKTKKSKMSFWRPSNISSKKSSFFPTTISPFEYKLSDPEMMKKGISLDTQHTGRAIRLFIFAAKLTNPIVSSLLVNKPENIFYSNEILVSSCSADGRCTLYNKKGIKSIQLLPGIVGPLMVVYSSKVRLFNGKLEPAPLAVFDFNGFGVVYDENGNKRLIYDQAQGILFDNPSKIPLKWKWQTYDPIIRRREEMKYLKPDEMLDIDDEEKQRIKARRELITKKSKKKKKKKLIPVPSNSETLLSPSTKPKFSPNRRMNLKTARSPQTPTNMHQNPKADADLLAKLFGDRKDNIEKSKLPVILKFTQTGCVIEPLLEPCKKVLQSEEGNQGENKEGNEGENKEGNQGENQEENQGEYYQGKTSRKTASLHSAFSSLKKDIRSRYNRGERIRELLSRCIPDVLSSTATDNIITGLKPIVMKINDTTSLVVSSQEHIHIDFLSHPFHFKFEIGVSVNSNSLNKLFAIKDRHEAKEPIPCIFEVMQDKSWEMKSICTKLKQMREEAKEKLEKAYLKY